MINKIAIRSFKSIEHVELELGILNVFIGANGTGKSNLLEAIGILSAAADGKVNDQTLLQRGVRPGVPSLYKSAFLSVNRALPHIYFSGTAGNIHYDVSLHNPLKDPLPSWKFKTESFFRNGQNLASRGPNMKDNPNTENGLVALKAVEWKKDDPALAFLQRLQGYVIFSPTTPVLRGVAPETQPRIPIGLSGGRLPDAVHELLRGRLKSALAKKVCSEVLSLISWAKSYGSGKAADLPLSPSASSTPMVVRFTDRYMRPKRNVLSGYDASEGALVTLFLAVLAAHPKAPAFCAVDNADHGLNPGLASVLMKYVADWLLENDDHRQLIITSHNPAVLDGLPLQDDRIRLFTVDRDNHGKTIVNRIIVDDKLRALAKKGWTMSRLWMNKLIGGMPNV